MIKYFVLCASLMCAYFYGPTWWLWLQAGCIAGLLLCELFVWMLRRQLEFEAIEQEIRRHRVKELNPFKWGNE